MSTLTIRDIDEHYLKVLGDQISNYTSTEVIQTIDKTAFQSGNAERLRHGWIDEITFNIDEQSGFRFCSETVENLRQGIVDFEDTATILLPFQYASGIKHQKKSIENIKNIFGPEQYEVIDEIINSVPYDISRERVITDIYKSNLHAIKNQAMSSSSSVLLNYYFGKGGGLTSNIFNEYDIDTKEIPMFSDFSAKPFKHEQAYQIIKVLYEMDYDSRHDKYTPVKPLLFAEEDKINREAADIYNYF